MHAPTPPRLLLPVFLSIITTGLYLYLEYEATYRISFFALALLAIYQSIQIRLPYPVRYLYIFSSAATLLYAHLFGLPLTLIAPVAVLVSVLLVLPSLSPIPQAPFYGRLIIVVIFAELLLILSALPAATISRAGLVLLGTEWLAPRVSAVRFPVISSELCSWRVDWRYAILSAFLLIHISMSIRSPYL